MIHPDVGTCFDADGIAFRCCTILKFNISNNDVIGGPLDSQARQPDPAFFEHTKKCSPFSETALGVTNY
jgi:hypothetical protein